MWEIPKVSVSLQYPHMRGKCPRCSRCCHTCWQCQTQTIYKIPWTKAGNVYGSKLGGTANLGPGWSSTWWKAREKKHHKNIKKLECFRKRSFDILIPGWKNMFLRDIHKPSDQYTCLHSWTIWKKTKNNPPARNHPLGNAWIFHLFFCWSIVLRVPLGKSQPASWCFHCLRIRVRRSRGSLPRKLIDWKVSAGYQLWDIVRSLHVSSQEGMNIPWCSRSAVESKQLQTA